MYNIKDEFEKHKESSHVVEPAFPCSSCDESFSTDEDLKGHIEANHYTKCPLCKLKFTDNDVFSVHIKNDHAPTCTSCDKKFTTKAELEEH